MGLAGKTCSPFGLPVAGLIFLLEGVGVPIPVEFPLGIMALRIARCGNTFWEMVWLMWATTVLGNTIGYAMGYYGGRPLALKLIGWFRMKPETWDKLEGWFRRHGLKVVVLTRWINWGFAQNMWLAGITRVPVGRFTVVMLVNNLLWAIGWTWLTVTAATYLTRRRILHFLHDSTMRAGLAAVAVILAGLAVWYFRRWRQRKQAIK